MATPYQNIFSRFVIKITDYDYADLPIEEAEEIFIGFLKSAIPKFTQCNIDLSKRDDTLKQFNADLSELEEEILANMMMLEWVTPKINHSNLMEQQLSTKDFNLYSQANHLKELREQKNEIENTINSLILKYSYNHDLVDLR